MNIFARALCLGCVVVLGCKEKPEASETETPSAPAEGSATTAKFESHSAPPAPQPKSIPAPADLNEPPKDAEKTPSGLVMKVEKKGTGTEHPGPQDTVRVDYTGWTTDGKMFDSSITRGRPASFRVDQVIKGWTEALQHMVAGEKRRVWIPADLAYGEKPRAGAPAGKLVFDIDLREIVPAPKPPPVPEDVEAPPKTATKTKSGLAYRVLKPGAGKKPSAADMVVVHYSGWTTDGQMFDSSVMRGAPATFRLNQVIKGWTEGVQLMKVGEKARFWIPGDLAYGDKPARPGAPAGMLVFDIELIDVKEPH